MWMRFVDRLRCPVSHGSLRLHVFQHKRPATEARHIESARRVGIAIDEAFSTFVEEGLLVSDSGWIYPITRGLPILLPYRTQVHDRFADAHRQALTAFPDHRFAEQEPALGERDVFRSFSEEWREYRYDGVLWDVSYDDNRRRLVAEVGLPEESWRGLTWIEIGCGIGMTTAQAQALSGVDAVGLDLSIAVLKASHQFELNPFLHFVQGSAFALPFPPAAFDLLYSRGVLHHTHSTKKAFMSVAPIVRPGGRIYLWVYGPGSLLASPLRVAAFAAEAVLRPILCRVPQPVATAVLTPIAGAYLGFNRLRRAQESEVQPYTFDRALHAARDRFTPRFAYRQDHKEVASWFQQAGCRAIEAVDAEAIPAADRDDYRRNTGVRGTMGTAAG